MIDKEKIRIFRVTYVIGILVLLTTIFFFKSRIPASVVKTANNSDNQPISFLKNIDTPSPSPYILPQGVSKSENPSKQVFKNSAIYFEFPSTWKVYTTDSSKSDPYSGLLFEHAEGNCINYVGSFDISATDPTVPSSYKIAQKNHYGTQDQFSRNTTINGRIVGLVTQPEGDGSGGFEPGITIDFLSNSKKLHYYFFAKRGCRGSYDETYRLDILPILKTIQLFD
jgi:hypothetical protein